MMDAWVLWHGELEINSKITAIHMLPAIVFFISVSYKVLGYFESP